MRVWTTLETRYVAENAAVMTYKELAEHLGRTSESVYQKARQIGVGKNRPWTNAERAELVRMRGERMSYKDIADALKRTPLSAERTYRRARYGN